MIIKNKNNIVLNKGVIVNKFSLDDMTIAFISGLTTKPTNEHIKLIDMFIKRTKTILTTKADVVYLGNINNSNDSFRNLVKDSHHGTISGDSLQFDSYWGFSNPSGTSYVDTNYNPAISGVNYTLNDAGIGISLFDYDEFSYEMPIFSNVLSAPYSGIFSSAGSHYVALNTTYFSVSNIPFKNGFHLTTRTASNVSTYINQNMINTTNSVISTDIPNANIFLFDTPLLGISRTYIRGLNLTYIGASLNDDEYIILNNAYNDYLIQCLFLKYGHDNWGVKMAKSYFLELHNFEKYEAWEVYEFLKRHQPDYVTNNVVPEASSDFTTDGTSWWSVAVGSLSWNNVDYCMTLHSSGVSTVYKTFLNTYVAYNISFKYRSSGYTDKLKVYIGYVADNILTDNCTPDWQTFNGTLMGLGYNGFNICPDISYVGTIEFDDIVINEKGYYYNTFSANTVCDYQMLFKAGGNLINNAWVKLGDVLRWNQDGIITNNNTMPAYTRDTNLGIITVTSTDGWNGLKYMQMRQTYNSVNSFYGNIPQINKLKISGNTTYYHQLFNRSKSMFLSDFNLMRRIYAYGISYPGYIKINLNKSIGNNSDQIKFDSNSTESYVICNTTLITNQITTRFSIQGFYEKNNVYGNLQNLEFNSLFTRIELTYCNITQGTSTWSEYVSICNFSDSKFNTAAVDDQLRVIDEYFVDLIVPIKNLVLNLNGTSMGIPTGGASNTNLLSIVAKHITAGFTATITVRTV